MGTLKWLKRDCDIYCLLDPPCRILPPFKDGEVLVAAETEERGGGENQRGFGVAPHVGQTNEPRQFMSRLSVLDNIKSIPSGTMVPWVREFGWPPLVAKELHPFLGYLLLPYFQTLPLSVCVRIFPVADSESVYMPTHPQPRGSPRSERAGGAVQAPGRRRTSWRGSASWPGWAVPASTRIGTDT
jgi:hypothetical protein